MFSLLSCSVSSILFISENSIAILSCIENRTDYLVDKHILFKNKLPLQTFLKIKRMKQRKVI